MRQTPSQGDTLVMKAHTPLAEVTVGMVEQVYVGRPDRCCCGCSGEYFTDAATVARILRNTQRTALPVMDFGTGYGYQTTGRMFNVYLKDL
jgi:hypothetical protein